MGSGRLTRPLGSARPPRVSHAPGVANGGGGKPGRRWLGRRVGPGSLRLPYLDWPSGAAEPQPRSFIKSGGWRPAFFHLLLPSASAPPFHPSWREGILVLQRWRRGSPLDNASLLLLRLRWQSQPRGEGGGGEAVGEAEALGEEEDGAARRPRLRQQLLLQWRAMLGMTLVSSSSGCAGRRAVAFVSRLHLRGRWSWIRRSRCGCT